MPGSIVAQDNLIYGLKYRSEASPAAHGRPFILEKMRCFAIFLLGLGLTAGLSLTATAQLIPQPKGSASTVWNPWENEHSGTHQPLRGIHVVGNGVAWASGARGTVLRTEDSGFVWQRCSMAEDAEKL